MTTSIPTRVLFTRDLASPAVSLHVREVGVYGNRDLFLACRAVGGKIRRVHQVVAKSWGGQPPRAVVSCVVWSERQADGVRRLDLAGGVRQIREDSDAHPSA